MSISSIRHRLQSNGNDWAALDEVWRVNADDSVVGGIDYTARSGRWAPGINVSVIIPALDAGETILACLTALEQSTFHRLNPQLLQVIVVDDGSTDSTWDRLKNYRGSLNLLALRQKHHGQSAAMNLGIAHSHAKLIVACDADMILTIRALEELVCRHQVLQNVLLVGFRTGLDPTSPVLANINHPDSAALKQFPFVGDNRFNFDHAGWPENMFAESKGFRSLGFERKLWMSSGETWDLPRMVYGCLFSLLRSDFELIGGFDERMLGWGYNDTLIGAKAIALGYTILPVVTASGWHIRHPIRSPTQWEEGALNRRKYEQFLDQPIMSNPNFIAGSLSRLEEWCEWPGTSQTIAAETQIGTIVLSSEDVAPLLFAFGNIADAIKLWEETGQCDRSSTLNHAAALRAARLYKQAIALLERYSNDDVSAEVLIEQGLSYAGLRRFDFARRELVLASEIAPGNGLCQYILGNGYEHHLQRARKFAAHSFFDLARRDCEAALIHLPGSRDANELLDMYAAR